MTKILQITDTYPPATGGLERTVALLSRELVARGHRVDVATLAGDGLASDETADGVDVHRRVGLTHTLRRFTSGSHLLHPTAPDPTLRMALQALIDELRPEIVHVHGWILATVLTLDLRGAGLLVSLHDHSVVCARKTLLRNGELDATCDGPSLRRCLGCARSFYGTVKGSALVLGLAEQRRRLGRVNRFLPVSDIVAEAALDVVDAARMRVVPPFVEDALLTTGRPRPSWLPDGDFLVFAGRTEHKGLSLVREAHRMLNSDIPLVLVGTDVPMRANSTVVVRPELAHDELMAVFEAATAVLAPSRWPEPFGLVAVEAMAARTPVVVSDVGAQPEIVAGAGLVVAPRAAQLAEALERLLGDEVLSARLVREGRHRAKEYTASAVVPRYEAQYYEVLLELDGS